MLKKKPKELFKKIEIMRLCYKYFENIKDPDTIFLIVDRNL